MVASFAPHYLVIAQTTEEVVPYWPWAAVLLTGAAAGFAAVWLGTLATRRAAREQAQELLEVAKREALVAAEEIKQQVEKGLQDVAEGRVLTHEELKERIARWRKSAGR